LTTEKKQKKKGCDIGASLLLICFEAYPIRVHE
jgi:hypothetical protein